jgi:hypothetical protein
MRTRHGVVVVAGLCARKAASAVPRRRRRDDEIGAAKSDAALVGEKPADDMELRGGVPWDVLERGRDAPSSRLRFALPSYDKQECRRDAPGLRSACGVGTPSSERRI